MITSIVFSKNRACQLDLLLSSIEENFKDTDEICVIYTHTSQYFKEGYDLLLERFSKNNQIQFILESDFQKDTISACAKAKNEYIAFFVDDDIVYRPVKISHLLGEVFSNNMACVSLRLGSNTMIQDYHSFFVDKIKASYAHSPNVVAAIAGKDGSGDKLFIWNWTLLSEHHTNFGYPFSVDGHIYHKENILPLIQQYEYHTPNALEGRFDKKWLEPNPNMCCLETSAVVNTPTNLVGSSTNRAGEKFGMSLESLNDVYLRNFVISMEDMDFSNIVGCHQELPIRFKASERGLE